MATDKNADKIWTLTIGIIVAIVSGIINKELGLK
jgi:hypothetical protein